MIYFTNLTLGQVQRQSQGDGCQADLAPSGMFVRGQDQDLDGEQGRGGAGGHGAEDQVIIRPKGAYNGMTNDQYIHNFQMIQQMDKLRTHH